MYGMRFLNMIMSKYSKVVKKLLVKKLAPTAILPTKANPKDAGFDLYSIEDVIIRPGETVPIKTGISIQPQLDQLAVTLLWDRSSMGKRAIHRLAGVIDVSYTGEIIVLLTNLNVFPVLEAAANPDLVPLKIQECSCLIKAGDKICQAIIQPVIDMDVVEVDDLTKTERGDKGFGSSGR